MSSLVNHAELPRELTGIKLLITTLAIFTATFLALLSQFISVSATTTIVGSLGVSEEDGSWMVTAYTVSKAIAILLASWLSSIFGRIRFFSLLAILFAITSLFCGLATNYPMLLFFRILQGLASGPLLTLSQILLLMIYPKKKKFALGLWGFAVIVGISSGPAVGGWFAYTYHWSWIFNINVPLGILIGIIVFAMLIDFECRPKREPIDPIGVILLIIALGAYQVILDKGNDADWWDSHFIVILTVIAVVGFCFFVVWEHFHPRPFIEFSLFKSRNFTVASIMLGLAMSLVFGSLIVEPNWLQNQLGYTQSWAGFALAPFSLGVLITFPFVTIYLKKFDIRLWVAAGFFCMIPSLLYLAYICIETGPFANLAWPRFFQGIGFAMFYIPLTSISIAEIAEEKVPHAAGMFIFLRMLFISTGASLTAMYYSRRENFFQSRYVESVIPSNPQYSVFFQALGENTGLKGLHAEAFVNQVVMDQAFTETFLEISYLQGFGFLLLMGLIIFLKPLRQ